MGPNEGQIGPNEGQTGQDNNKLEEITNAFKNYVIPNMLENIEVKRPHISINSGDIAKFKVDALITPVNSGGLWFGAIDNIIRQHAKNQFHNQLKIRIDSKGCKHGDVIDTYGKDELKNSAGFKNVLFIIDDLEGPLNELIYNSLSKANEYGLVSVSMPVMRTGVMLGAVERNLEEVVNEIKNGLDNFYKTNPLTLKEIKIIVYNNDELIEMLNAELINK